MITLKPDEEIKFHYNPEWEDFINQNDINRETYKHIQHCLEKINIAKRYGCNMSAYRDIQEYVNNCLDVLMNKWISTRRFYCIVKRKDDNNV